MIGPNGCGKRTMARMAIKVLNYSYEESIYTQNVEDWKKFITDYAFKLSETNQKGVLVIQEKHMEGDLIIEGLDMLLHGQYVNKYANEDDRRQMIKRVNAKIANINYDKQDPQKIEHKLNSFLQTVSALLHIIVIVDDSSQSWMGLYKRQHNFFSESYFLR